MYGTNVESDATMVSPEVGIVNDCTLESVSIPEGQEMLVFEFKQPNGGTVRHTEFPANPDYGDVKKQATDTSRRVKHIATKVMTEEEFVMDDIATFLDYSNKVITLFGDRAKDKKFRMLFIYKGQYVSIPRFPNFIENMEIPEDETSIEISAYNAGKLTRVFPDAENAPAENGIPKKEQKGDDLPF